MYGLQCLGRHLRLIKVDVDLVSNKTFSSICDLTEDIVLTTAMLVGVSIDLWALLLLLSRRVHLHQCWCCLQTLSLLFNCLGAFLVEPRLKFVLQWSAFVNLTIVYYVNPDLYRTISKYFIIRVLSLGFY